MAKAPTTRKSVLKKPGAKVVTAVGKSKVSFDPNAGLEARLRQAKANAEANKRAADLKREVYAAATAKAKQPKPSPPTGKASTKAPASKAAVKPPAGTAASKAASKAKAPAKASAEAKAPAQVPAKASGAAAKASAKAPAMAPITKALAKGSTGPPTGKAAVRVPQAKAPAKAKGLSWDEAKKISQEFIDGKRQSLSSGLVTPPTRRHASKSPPASVSGESSVSDRLAAKKRMAEDALKDERLQKALKKAETKAIMDANGLNEFLDAVQDEAGHTADVSAALISRMRKTATEMEDLDGEDEEVAAEEEGGKDAEEAQAEPDELKKTEVRNMKNREEKAKRRRRQMKTTRSR